MASFSRWMLWLCLTIQKSFYPDSLFASCHRQVDLSLESPKLSLPMSFHPVPNPNPLKLKAEWRVDDDAVIKLQIHKQIKGAASAPDKLVNYIVNSVMPNAIKVNSFVCM